MAQSRICIISTLIPPDFTGAGLRAYNHAKYLGESGYKVDIISSTYNPTKLKNVEVHTIGLSKEFFKYKVFTFLNLPRIFYKSFWLIRKLKPEIVHCFGFESWFSICLILVSKLHGIKTLAEITLFGLDDPLAIKRSKGGNLKFKIFSRVDKIISLSPISVFSCRKAGFPIGKTQLIPNSVNTLVFHPVDFDKRVSLRNKFNMPLNHKVFITIGAVVSRKGIKDIIDIYSKVQPYYKESSLVVVGPVDIDEENRAYYKTLLQYVDSLDISQNVIFTGRASNVNEWLQISDIFLFASKGEGFPSVIIQAMATGIPIISLPLENIIDYIISNREDGIISENIDTAASEAIGLLSDENEYKKISLRAINKVLKNYTDEIVMNSYISLYSSL